MTEAEQERARVVAWMRGQTDEMLAFNRGPFRFRWRQVKAAAGGRFSRAQLLCAILANSYAAAHCEMTADAIDRGDHLKGVE